MNMKKRPILIAVISVALVIGALLWVQPMAAPRTILKLSGQEGLPFKATVKTDGVEVTFSGKLPAELQVTGHSIDCGFQKMQPDGRISLGVETADGEAGSAATSSPQGGVRAQIYKKLFVSKFVTTTF
jgi:hypothetical protein